MAFDLSLVRCKVNNTQVKNLKHNGTRQTGGETNARRYKCAPDARRRREIAGPVETDS